MKICFPVQSTASDLNAPLCEHFGSAEAFVVYDTEAGTLINPEVREATDDTCGCGSHRHSLVVDAVICNSIGGGMLGKLQASGIQVYQSQAATVAQAIEQFQQQALPKLETSSCCGGHGHTHAHGSCGCSHEEGHGHGGCGCQHH